MAECFVRVWWWEGYVECFCSGFEAWRGRFSVAEMMVLSGGKEGVWVDGWRFLWCFFLDGSLMIDCRLSWMVWFAGCWIDVDRFFMFFFWLYNIYRCMLFFWSYVVNNYKNIDSYKIFSLCFLVCGCFLFYLCIRFRVIF